jgi:hypothetical protein
VSTALTKDAALERVLEDIGHERAAQDRKWGEQNHPDGTGMHEHDAWVANYLREECEKAFAEGRGTWRHILNEEIGEANTESDPAKLREELVQVAAVAAAWVEAIDRRAA